MKGQAYYDREEQRDRIWTAAVEFAKIHMTTNCVTKDERAGLAHTVVAFALAIWDEVVTNTKPDEEGNL